MKLMVISNVIDALRMIPKALIKGMEELKIGWRAEPIQTTAFFMIGQPEYSGEFCRPEGVCCYLDSSERPSAIANEKDP